MNALTLSVTQASSLTSLHRATLYRAIAANKIRTKLVGRRRLIDAASLREFVGVE